MAARSRRVAHLLVQGHRTLTCGIANASLVRRKSPNGRRRQAAGSRARELTTCDARRSTRRSDSLAPHRSRWRRLFGARPVDKVDSAEILKALNPVWTSKPETARRLKQRIKLICHGWPRTRRRSGTRIGLTPDACRAQPRRLPACRPEDRHSRCDPAEGGSTDAR
jgi:hypothetical protein